MTRLFLTAFLQVYFVALNTIFLASGNWFGVAVSSFAISFIWTINVKKMAFSLYVERVTYALGAMTGSLLGLLTTKL